MSDKIITGSEDQIRSDKHFRQEVRKQIDALWIEHEKRSQKVSLEEFSAALEINIPDTAAATYAVALGLWQTYTGQAFDVSRMDTLALLKVYKFVVKGEKIEDDKK